MSLFLNQHQQLVQPAPQQLVPADGYGVIALYHEILLALVGHTGDAVIEVYRPVAEPSSRSADDNASDAADQPEANVIRELLVGFEVCRDLVPSVITEQERQLIDQIVILGFYYRMIERFIAAHDALSFAAPSMKAATAGSSHGASSSYRVVDNTKSQSSSRAVGVAGLYVRALCRGLDKALDSYRLAVLESERAITQDPAYPLSKLLVSLHHHTIVLPALYSAVCEIIYGRGVRLATPFYGDTPLVPSTAQPLHGGEIVQLLHRRSQVGIPTVQAVMRGLLDQCNAVLLNQLAAWVTHGVLADPYAEFFIERVEWEAAQQRSAADDSKLADGAHTGSVSSGDVARPGWGDAPHAEWNASFRVRVAMLPAAYIPLSLANKFLFVGRAVRTLQHSAVSSFMARSRRPPERITGPSSGPALAGSTKHGSAIELAAFTQLMQSLRQIGTLEGIQPWRVADLLRARAAELLWELVVVRARLTHHLRALRDFFLLGRGEFYQSFVGAVEASGLFAVAPGPRAERDLNDGPFQTAAQICGIDTEASLSAEYADISPLLSSVTTSPNVAASIKTSNAAVSAAATAITSTAARSAVQPTALNWEADLDEYSGLLSHYFARLAVRIESPVFVFTAFSAEQVSGYDTALASASRGTARGVSAAASVSGGNVVLVGDAEFSKQRRTIDVTTQGTRQVGAVWFAGRRVVDRGFKTKFRVQIRRPPESVTGYHRDRAPAGGAASSDGDWVPRSDGFSFVIQNHALSALPVVYALNASGSAAAASDGGAGAGHDQSSYHGIGNSLEIFFHVKPRAVAGAGSEISMHHRNQSGAVPPLLATPSRRMSLAPSGLPSTLQRPQSSFGAVQPDSPSDFVSVLLRDAAPAGRSDSRSGGAVAPPPTVLGRAHARRSLGDGEDHVIAVEYDPKSSSSVSAANAAGAASAGSGAGAGGVIKIFVDDMTHPVLTVPLKMSSRIRLDQGRAWVGFCAATGFAVAEVTDAPAVATPVDLSPCSRVLKAWEFQELDAHVSNAWRTLRLDYKVDAPLDLVLLKDDVDRYNSLFAFLFFVKRVQIRLQQCWPWQMRTPTRGPIRATADPAQRKLECDLLGLFAVRTKMQHFVDTLQFYLQVDIVDAQFAKLLQGIAASRDFESVRRTHEEFLTNMADCCFLHERVILNPLQRALDICSKFADSIHRPGAPPESQPDLSALAALGDEFTRTVCHVFGILARKTGVLYSKSNSRATDSGLASAVAQLVLRLDFNRYWSEQAAALGAIALNPAQPL